MPSNRSGSDSGRTVWRWRGLAFVIIAVAAVLRVIYLAGFCPLDLAPDEAHYWDWSRHLDWSYYSKGPLVAYLIRGSCGLAASWSESLCGNEMLAVRLPAVLCASLLLASLYLLTAQVYGREKLALAVVALALPLPVIVAGGTLMTIDAPYTCCWGWALVFGFRAVFRGRRWCWAAAGVATGLGILAKYTMVLWPVSLGLFLLFTPRYRRLLVQPGFWLMAGISAAFSTPIIIWNWQHGWVTFYHLQGHAGLKENAGGIHWFGPLKYLGGQFALLLGFYFVAWLAAMVKHRPPAEPRPEVRYLWWMSLPVFLIFLPFSLKNGDGELNWPVTAYLSGLVLAAGWLADQLAAAHSLRRRLLLAAVWTASLLSLTLTILIHNSVWIQPLLMRLSEPPRPDALCPLRRLDPTCRLKGWRTLSAAVDRVRKQHRAAGRELVLAASNWAFPGELAFYCQGQPVAYCLGPALGSRHSQYDFWRPNPLADPGQFLGQSFLVLEVTPESLRTAFARLDPPVTVVHSEQGQPLARWTFVVGHGFRGFRRPVGNVGY